MKQKISLDWKGKMSFETEVNGHKLVLDAPAEVGGEDKGPRPKPLVLVALAGCTAMDVVSILAKMKVEIDDLTIDCESNVTDEHPKQFEDMKLIYRVKGKDVPYDKVEKAVKLSQEKYCGVSATLQKALDVSYEIVINE